MRKNLLLLIMFCLIATIGANATATKSGTTLTFTDCKAGEIKSYLENSETKSCLSTITSVVVIGAINGDDIQSMQFTKLQSLDLSKATGLTSGDDLKFTSGTGNLQNKLKSTLETIKFPKGPTGIPASCMISFTSLSNVIIPSGYKTIGSEAFRNCTSLNIINIPEGVETIGSWAFSQARIQSIRLPKSLITLKSATKPLNVLIAFTRPLITEFADNLNLKHPLLPTISPYPTM